MPCQKECNSFGNCVLGVCLVSTIYKILGGLVSLIEMSCQKLCNLTNQAVFFSSFLPHLFTGRYSTTDCSVYYRIGE